MSTTYQFKNLNILEHGLSVRKHFLNIISDLDNNNHDRYEFPVLLVQNWNRFKTKLYKPSIMSYYQIYHDCGKPFVLRMDHDGKQHFPGHAEESAKKFEEYFPNLKYTSVVSNLIKHDMIFHSGSAEEIDFFLATQPEQCYISLWMTSFAELYANKEMFDSSNQTSFKIKYKKLKRILNKFL